MSQSGQPISPCSDKNGSVMGEGNFHVLVTLVMGQTQKEGTVIYTVTILKLKKLALLLSIIWKRYGDALKGI